MSEEQEQGNQVSQEDRAFAAAIAGTANVVANTGMEADAPITENGRVKTRGHQQVMDQVLRGSEDVPHQFMPEQGIPTQVPTDAGLGPETPLAAPSQHFHQPYPQQLARPPQANQSNDFVFPPDVANIIFRRLISMEKKMDKILDEQKKQKESS